MPNVALTLQEQLAQSMRASLESGSYAPGDKIPSEAELASVFEVSRVTVRAALAQLVDEGLLVKKQGKGTFVRQRRHVETSYSSGSFTETCRAMGAEPSTKVLSLKQIEAPLEAAIIADDDGMVTCLRRLRSVDGQPCIFEIDYLPTRYASVSRETLESLETQSLFELLARDEAVIPERIEDHFKVSHAPADIALLLELDGDAVLEVLETVYQPDGDVAYVNQQLIASDRYEYVTTSLKR